MNEEILKMSGDIESDFQAFQAAQPEVNDIANFTIFTCSQGCSAINCIAE
ncbi:hypothetical protein [Pseudomonas alkylphenolica]